MAKDTDRNETLLSAFLLAEQDTLMRGYAPRKQPKVDKDGRFQGPTGYKAWLSPAHFAALMMERAKRRYPGGWTRFLWHVIEEACPQALTMARPKERGTRDDDAESPRSGRRTKTAGKSRKESVQFGAAARRPRRKLAA